MTDPAPISPPWHPRGLHRVMIRPLAGFFSVEVMPAHPQHGARVFGDWVSARDHAHGLNRAHGWLMRDLTPTALRIDPEAKASMALDHRGGGQ